jgi:hypothetical protein
MTQLGSKTGWSHYPIHTIPHPLDIVWCKFPELPQNPSVPGPKLRPGIVHTVQLDPDYTIARIRVCYGTSKLKKFKYPNDLFVENAAQLTLLGLTQATRFEIDRLVWVPWASEWFEPKDGSKTPVIGRLTALEIGQLSALQRIREAAKRIK